MSTSAGFRRGFIKAATDYGFSTKEAGLLQNLASQGAKGVEEVAAKPNAAKGFLNSELFNSGVPLAGGLTAGYFAHEKGADPVMSGAWGAGGALITSPRRWTEIWRLAKGSADPITHGAKMGLNDVAYKMAIPAGAAAGSMVPGILTNMRDTTANSAAVSAALAKELPGILAGLKNTANSTANITDSFSKQAPELSKNINNVTEGMSNFWDPKTGQGPQLANSAKSIASTLDREVPKMTSAVSNIGNEASTAINAFGKLPAVMEHPYNSLSPTQKLMLTAGAGGLGLLGINRLLRKEPRKAEVPQ